MNEIKVFENQEFGDLRTVTSEGQTWFHASDVCKVLEFQNPTNILRTRINESDKAIFNIGLQGGGHNFVNESGLYSLILGSRKPQAERFKHWVTSEVLPSIRKTGTYITDDAFGQLLADPDNFIRMLTEYKAEKSKRLNLEAQAKANEPKVLFADSVAASHQSILVGELAKLLRQNGVEIGQNRLFDWLRNNGWLIRSGESRNMPTQYSMEMGLFEIKERTFNDPSGNIRITKTTKVTGKGQLYFVNVFLKKQKEPAALQLAK